MQATGLIGLLLPKQFQKITTGRTVAVPAEPKRKLALSKSMMDEI